MNTASDMNGLNGAAEVPLAEDAGLDIRRHLAVLRRRWLAIFACLVIVLTLAALYTFRQTPIYRASARLLIEQRIPQLTPFDTVQEIQDKTYLETHVELITSRAVLEKAIQDDADHWLATVLASEEEVALRNPGLIATVREEVDKLLSTEPIRTAEPWERLRGAIQVNPVRNTSLLDISVQGSVPAFTARVANAVARAYVDYSVAARQENAGETFGVLQLQRLEQEKALIGAEDELLGYREKTATPELGAGGGETLVHNRLKRLSEEFTAVQLQRIGLAVANMAAERAIQGKDDAMALLGVKYIREDPVVIRLYEQIVELRQQMESASQVYGEKHPEPNGKADIEALLGVKYIREDPVVSRIYEQIVEVRQQMESASQFYGNKHPEMADLEMRLANLQVQFEEAIQQVMAGLAMRLASLQVQFKEAVLQVGESVRQDYEMLADRERELITVLQAQSKLALDAETNSDQYDRLKRNVERQTKVFDVILDRMKEVDLTKDVRVTNVSLKQQAEVPRMPISPNKKRALLLGLFLGLMLGVVAAYGLEHLDDTVKTPEDVERQLQVPWLGYVPRIRSASRDTDGLAARARLTLDNPTSYESEAFRSIRTNVHFSAPPGDLKSLVVTSAAPQEGKTVVATNLAVSFARAGRRVLLVDADLRRPMVHKALGISRKPGLADVIIQGTTVEKTVQLLNPDGAEGLENLHVLTAGSHVPSPSELLGSVRAGDVMDALEASYDIVIYDSSPALFTADAAPLFHRCQGIILVVRAAKCRRKTAALTIKRLTGIGGHLIGVVLNDVRPAVLHTYGDGGYYYNAGYYRHYEQTPEEDTEK